MPTMTGMSKEGKDLNKQFLYDMKGDKNDWNNRGVNDRNAHFSDNSNNVSSLYDSEHRPSGSAIHEQKEKER